MSLSHLRLPTLLAFSAGCLATLLIVLVFAAIQQLEAYGDPAIYLDVNDRVLKAAGLGFSRPESASNACMAIVGHGMGDSCTYLSFDIPSGELASFLANLPFCEKVATSDARTFPYRDSLPNGVRELIMPDSIPSEADVYSLENGVGVYDVDRGRFHMCTF